MASRRSIRRFSSKGVEPGILRDLVRIGVSAPSATNSQCWTFTIIPDGPSVHALCGPVAEYFRRVCRLSSFAPLRYILRFLGKPELDQFHRGYRPFILDCLEKWDNAGVDPFFRGAQAAILIGSRPGASRHGADDAQLATQNILLAAHAMGLGTCLVGLALAAFRDDSSAYELLKIPREEKIHSVIAVGYPETRYQSVTGRAEPLVRTTRIP
jgi:nitroreductase